MRDDIDIGQRWLVVPRNEEVSMYDVLHTPKICQYLLAMMRPPSEPVLLAGGGEVVLTQIIEENLPLGEV